MRVTMVFALIAAAASTAVADPTYDLCSRDREDTDNAWLVCYDYTGEVPKRISNGTQNDNIVIWPNLQVLVRVFRISKAAAVDISLGGTPGETKFKLDGIEVSKSTDAASPLIRRLPPANSGGYDVYEARFVPRTTGHVPLSLSVTEVTPSKPRPDETIPIDSDSVERTRKESGGAVELTVKWTTKPPPPKKTTSTFEFLVPNVYGGALRLGLSAIFGLNEHQYSKRQAPSVTVMEVVDHGASNAMAELVVGYAAYWEAFTRYRGRDYVRYFKPLSPHRLAPYFGVGISSLTTSGEGTRVRWLRSFYIGGELELFQSASVAVAFTVSRVDTLAHGIEVGGPIAKDTSIVDTEFRPGLAIVLNFTPDFLKFAAGMK